MIKYIFDDYGAQTAVQFIGECQFLANRYMLYIGYSIGIDDCVVIPRKIVKSIVDNDIFKSQFTRPRLSSREC